MDLGELLEFVREFDDGTSDSRDIAERCRDYYDSNQLSEVERRALKKRKQPEVVINRIKPKMDGLMGMERQNRTTAKAYPRTPKHEKGATAATEGIRYVLDDNAYPQIRSACWDNLLMEGTAGAEVNVRELADGFEILINHIQWDRLIYDPHARTKNFADARFKGQFVWLDYDIALERYPNGKDVLEAMIAGSTTFDDKPRWLDTARKRVRIIELYWMHGGDWQYACFTGGGFLKGPMKSAFVTEMGETEDPYEFASLFVSRDGVRYGASYQLLDVQDEVNKRRSKALHLMSVRQVMLERGAVEDVNKVRQELAKPDGVIEVTPGMMFELLKTNDMLAAQFNLLQEAKMEIDAVSYNAAASGKDTHLQSGVALRSREVAGQTEVAPMFDVLKNLDVRVYRKVWNRIKQYWKAPMWIRITDDPSKLRWVGLNQPMTKLDQALEQAQAQGAKPEQLEQMKMQLALDPSASQIVDTQNDVATLDVDIVIADAPDTVTQQMEDFQTLGEMVKSGFPMPPIAVIEASPLSNKDRIIKMMQEQPQIPEKIKEQMQSLQEQAQGLAQENQALKADQQGEAAKLQQKTQANQQELQLKAQVQAEEIRLERERAEATIKLEREKAQASIALEREKAQATLDLESMKAEQQGSLEEKKMQMQSETEGKKLEFQKEQALASDPNYKDMAMMPQVMEALQQMAQGINEGFKQLAEIQAKSLAAQEETLATLKAPKSVSVGGVRKDMEGRITGATVTVQ